MTPLPRLAIGAVQENVDTQPVLWGLMEALRQYGFQIQSFLSRACFSRFHGEAVATGITPRHLDSWLMSPEACRARFLRGAQGADLAIVSGEFGAHGSRRLNDGGSLDVLCDWLDLPRIAVLDAVRCNGRLPAKPGSIDAVILDRVGCEDQFSQLQSLLEHEWCTPVLGGLQPLPHVRGQVSQLGCRCRPPRELCEVLGEQFRRRFYVDRLLELATRRPLPWIPARATDPPFAFEPITLALAYDKAFSSYFPDTIEAFEALGATVVDFSPMHDERLPYGVDVVYLGCGHPERFGYELSQNHCMKLALREHLRGGGRIYSEGGGLAYLCWELDAGYGHSWRMAGIFPAVARLMEPAAAPTPIEVTVDHPTWLAPSGTILRAYRNPRWQLEPVGLLTGCVDEPPHHYDLVQSNRALGSLLHLDFAAMPSLLAAFFRAPGEQAELVDPWSVAI